MKSNWFKYVFIIFIVNVLIVLYTAYTFIQFKLSTSAQGSKLKLKIRRDNN